MTGLAALPPGCRSPAEGAYSEGFIRAKFTQDFCIGGEGGRACFLLCLEALPAASAMQSIMHAHLAGSSKASKARHDSQMVPPERLWLCRHATCRSRPAASAECPATGSLFSLKDGSIVSW